VGATPFVFFPLVPAAHGHFSAACLANQREPAKLARQLSTRRWWKDAASRFDLKISDLVIAECSAGDPSAAAERLQVVSGIDILAPNDEAESLADAL